MNPGTLQSNEGIIATLADPFVTMGGGTILFSSPPDVRPTPEITSIQLLISAYQRRIFELRQTVEMYKRLVDQLLIEPQVDEEYSTDTRHSVMSSASVNAFNSMIEARIPESSMANDPEGDF